MNYVVDTCMLLLSSSMALAGLIAVFIVARWDAWDNYVDNRKNLLKCLLENDIEANPDILLAIQGIGKSISLNSGSITLRSEQDFLNYFQTYIHLLTPGYVKETGYVNDIYKLRNRRELILNLAWWSIGILLSLSLYYLVAILLPQCFLNSKIALKISIAIFILTLILSATLIHLSVRGKPKPTP